MESNENILKEYIKPLVIKDDILGRLTFNKYYNMFEGETKWLNKNIDISIDVDIDNKKNYDKAIKKAYIFFEEQKEWDKKLKEFAAEKLTEIANEWAKEGGNYDGREIRKKDFIRRISLAGFSLADRGDFVAYYNDDDMFFGHTVSIYGNIKKGLKDASIEG